MNPASRPPPLTNSAVKVSPCCVTRTFSGVDSEKSLSRASAYCTIFCSRAKRRRLDLLVAVDVREPVADGRLRRRFAERRLDRLQRELGGRAVRVREPADLRGLDVVPDSGGTRPDADGRKNFRRRRRANAADAAST